MSHCIYCEADFVSGRPCRTLAASKKCPEWAEHYAATIEAQPVSLCDHQPMKSALDDTIGCTLCGHWLGWRA